MTFSGRLREMRDKHLMTRQDLAERSGLSLMTIRSYERAKRRPTLGSLAKVIIGLTASRDEALELRTLLISPLCQHVHIPSFQFDLDGNNKEEAIS